MHEGVRTEVDAVDQVSLASQADEEVIRLDVAVDERFVMNVLNSLQQLVGDHQDRLQVKLPEERERAQEGQASGPPLRHRGTFGTAPSEEQITAPAGVEGRADARYAGRDGRHQSNWLRASRGPATATAGSGAATHAHLSQKLKRSSSDGPSKSMTMTL